MWAFFYRVSMLPIRDYYLNGYDFDGVPKTISLRTVEPRSDPPQRIDVFFDGVRDDYLRDTLLASILFGSDPVDADPSQREIISCTEGTVGPFPGLVVVRLPFTPRDFYRSSIRVFFCVSESVRCCRSLLSSRSVL
ncbi:hypothetical protein K227x_23310 [Rubripirellula lacrimiformis]|uniref:Uncharacterized protein n=1 Tax=Rubripirellula lacrimiformis TaxID=1930273 RepID=A0A517N9Y0_9BACT|nr:hypothetical protein K227x_23310 [Rubripirellula lacrimiformis]